MSPELLTTAMVANTGSVLILLLVIAWKDWKQRRIPNACVLLLGLLVAVRYPLILLGGGDALSGYNLMFGVAVLTALAVPGYSLGLLGAGDVKLMAVLLPMWPTMQYLQAFSTGVLGLVLFCLVADLARRVTSPSSAGGTALMSTLRQRGIPVGTAMALGGLVTTFI